VLVNSSLIERKVARTDVQAYYIPANDIAAELGNVRTAGMVMLGALIQLTGIISMDAFKDAFGHVFGAKAEKLLPVNLKALEAGMNAVK